jgi:hypothetical protein
MPAAAAELVKPGRPDWRLVSACGILNLRFVGG